MFCNCGLRLVQKWLTLSMYKMTLKKKFKKQKKLKKAEKISRNESKTYVMDLLSNFCPIRDHIFKTFFLKLDIYFLEIGVNCVTNCAMPP